MRSNEILWNSEGLNLNADTCIDVSVKRDGVILGQLGKTWLHDLHLSADAARWLAQQLQAAADHFDSITGDAS